MATVLVEVTLRGDTNVPTEVLALAAAAPQVQRHGLARRGNGPWRARFLVRGPDCIETATSLERKLRALGYDAEASFWP